MPVRIATLAETVQITEALDKISKQGRAGHALVRILNDQIDPDNFDQSLRGLLTNLEAAIEDVRNARRQVMFPDA